MKSATVSELRDHLSGFLRDVEAGERVRVLRRDQVIAILAPPNGEIPRNDARFEALVRAGVVRRGSGEWPSWITDIGSGEGDALLAALLAEREESR